MSRITKVELQQQLAVLAEDYRVLREKYAALEMDLEIARKATKAAQPAPPANAAPCPTEFASYYDYVGACRAHAKRVHAKVVSYKSRAQFDEICNVPAH